MRHPREEGTILCTAGPCLQHNGRPGYAHTGATFRGRNIFAEKCIRLLAQTTAERVFTYDPGATFLQEAVLRGIAKPGETVAVVVNGGFGLRWKGFAEALGIKVVVIGGEMAKPVSASEVTSALQSHPEAKVLLWASADTSVGIGNPSKDYAKALRDERGDEGLAVADCVLELTGQAFSMDDWGIDVVVGSSGKGVGSVANLGLGAVNAHAESWMRNIGPDVGSPTLSLVKWWDMMKEGQFHHTNGVDQVMAFADTCEFLFGQDPGGKESVAALIAVIEETRRLNTAMLAGFEAMGLFNKAGFDFLVEDKASRLPQLTALTLPEDLNGDPETEIRAELEHTHRVYIGGGLGGFKGKIWRLGIMGAFNLQDLLFTLWAIEQVLKDKANIHKGAAVDAARAAYT